MKSLLIPVLATVLVLWVGIAWMVIKEYRQSRNFGFVILGCGVLLWPAFSSLLVAAFGGLVPFSAVSATGITPGEFMALLIYAGHIIREGLILLGLIVIGRSINRAQPQAIHTP